MASEKSNRPEAHIPRGFRDRMGAELAAERRMLDAIRSVYEAYGFDALETSALEYADALGKFLPDQDRPNEGVFALRDDDEQWLAMRYDLTAPLARFVAENFDVLPKPFRRYQVGQVFRNEKPGPGRYREFTQFDADTVGTASVFADAEGYMMLCDAFDKLGLAGQYVVKVNNRKVLNGVLESIGLAKGGDAQRGAVLRAIDKLDRLGPQGVMQLLGAGRKDESGDFTKGAGLSEGAIARVMAFTAVSATERGQVVKNLETLVGDSEEGQKGIAELREIDAILRSAGYEDQRVRFDPSIVRGLAYYTGPVVEAELIGEVTNEDGQVVRFGSVASGGRYDDLVTRFKGVEVPATGVSIGVSRLLAALIAKGLISGSDAQGPVVVLVMDREAMGSYLAMVRELRAAGVRAEIYTGTSGMKAQLKYADKRRSPAAIIEGGDERAKGAVTIKDLALGAEHAKNIKDREQWSKGADAQVTVARAELVSAVKQILSRHSS
ncbi:MAG: histidine--tRNA ligase [Alphaproteobacteria bacterium]|nr:histidine--tRNA ligase [Alphaproteobacteria bacterium]